MKYRTRAQETVKRRGDITAWIYIEKSLMLFCSVIILVVCYRLNVYFPQIPCVMALEGRVVESCVILNGNTALIKEDPQSWFTHFTMWETACRIYQWTKGQTLTRHWIFCFLDLELPSFQNCENKVFVVCKLPPWYRPKNWRCCFTP